MILVTGGTGLVGSHLIYELLKRDEPVRALIRNPIKIKKVQEVFGHYAGNPENLISKVEWTEGDMLDLYSLEEAFSGIKKVYHCAALVSFDGKDKNEIIKANVKGTENIVNMGLQANIQKLCHVSSIASLGKTADGSLIDENTAWVATKNQTVYSISKYKSEMEVWRGIQEGLNAVIVNPSVILGLGFWNAGSGQLFTKLAKGLKHYTSGATGFVDVRDVADAMVELMESNVSGERFILNAENLNYKTLFDAIAGAMKVDKPNSEATKPLLKIAVALDAFAGALGIKKREITKEIARASFSISKYSNGKIKSTIGKNFIPIEKSINEISEKYKNDLTIR